ncbi:unnamed protein product [Vitrella brassicaformis CCMP3155]|uniref:Uncharacterized protein n=1 Tax=Vitrella brassicaformis (strain CCMP3155) TaxID=1169540 RepID=A0A0G4ER94_VITBC|nr:unnamed protein product [Vitrella brassicaformis CCMP3155]|mmetsp:Transcript_18523/g.44616  ORF Transcript_18523/g.44616 Transcript_18523/m.44616 type:complete len:163 (-) Transcript_18523:661-1149(-)|eukprot:CEM00773.1 unnamed protein product [Vitrella brassicaformis CCMP3155]
MRPFPCLLVIAIHLGARVHAACNNRLKSIRRSNGTSLEHDHGAYSGRCQELETKDKCTGFMKAEREGCGLDGTGLCEWNDEDNKCKCSVRDVEDLPREECTLRSGGCYPPGFRAWNSTLQLCVCSRDCESLEDDDCDGEFPCGDVYFCKRSRKKCRCVEMHE